MLLRYLDKYSFGDVPAMLLNTRLKLVMLLNPQLYATVAMLSYSPDVSLLQAWLIRISLRNVTKVTPVCFLKYLQKACGVRWASAATSSKVSAF